MRKTETDLETLGCMDKIMQKWRNIAEIGGVRGQLAAYLQKSRFL